MKRNSSGEENEELPSKLARRHSGPYLRYRFSLHQKVELDLKFAFVYYDNASRPDGHGILADYPLILQVNWKSGIVDGEMIVANVERCLHRGEWSCSVFGEAGWGRDQYCGQFVNVRAVGRRDPGP